MKHLEPFIKEFAELLASEFTKQVSEKQKALRDNQTQKTKRNLLTVKQFSEQNQAFSQSSLRWLIFNSINNGLDKTSAIVRIGRRVFIDLDKFNQWLENESA